MNDEVRRWLAEIAGEAAPSEPGGGAPDNAAADGAPAAAAPRCPATGGRLRRLLLLAGLPWALLGAVLAATALRGRDAAPAPPRPSPSPLATTAGEAAATPPAAAAQSRAAAQASAAAQQRPAYERRAAAAAAMAVRLAVTDGRRRYVDTVAAEAVEQVGDVMVVTLQAVVLHGRHGRWRAARASRYGVAVAADGRVLSPPWPLPAPPRRAQPAWRRVAGLEQGAAAALRAAGYRRVRVLRVARDPALAGVLAVRLRARGPGGDGRRRHVVWLRHGPQPSVLGHRTDGDPRTAGARR